jgi:hypothetical protein
MQRVQAHKPEYRITQMHAVQQMAKPGVRRILKECETIIVLCRNATAAVD